MTVDKYITEQEKYWRGEFGNNYIERNFVDEKTLMERTRVWAKMLGSIVGDRPASILEVGSNVGLNLRALARLTDARLIAVEPNANARKILVDDKVVPVEDVIDAAARSIPLADNSADLVFTCGVLIHISPDDLLESLREIHRVSHKYILCSEYFSPEPEEVNYRNHKGLLFKRDFGKFWIDNFSDLKLLDYGFFWKHASGIDNQNWWIFEKIK